MLYLWLKSFHIIAMVAWMASMFYLPRLFVYHAEAGAGSTQSATFKVMERRLLKAIATPAMIATWILGLVLAVQGGWFSGGNGWLHAKLLFVVLLSGFHGFCAKNVRLFADDRNTRSGRFFRIANEVPTVLLVAIVLLVVIKPF